MNTHLTASFPGKPGKPAPERFNQGVFNEARDNEVAVASMDHVQIICTSLQTDNHASNSSLNFYRPNALPDAQRAVSKH